MRPPDVDSTSLAEAVYRKCVFFLVLFVMNCTAHSEVVVAVVVGFSAYCVEDRMMLTFSPFFGGVLGVFWSTPNSG